MLKSLLILVGIVALLSIAGWLLRNRLQPQVTVPANARAGDLSLQPCDYRTAAARYRADCGTLIVPENRLDPSSRLIALPLKRIHAANASPLEPIFRMGGGPGMSNMTAKLPDDLLRDHDVVMLGYRGVDGSSVLDCPEFSEAVLGDGRNVLSNESLSIMTEAVRACHGRLEAAGVDLSGYTVQQVVEDLEAARLRLGYGKIDLLSESYGTRVAQVYAALHPRGLHRSVMMGINPPGHFVWEPAMADRQIEYYGRLWAKDDDARARTTDLAAAMRRVSHGMPHRWLIFPIDPGKVNSMAFVMLFNRNTAAMVFDAYVAADHGDPSGLALMSMAYDLVVPRSFVWGDFFAKGASADLDLSRDYVSDLRAPDSIIGSPVALMIWGPLSRAWLHDALPAELRRVQPTEVETLLVSGSVDFSTPAQYATDDLLPSLERGRQVILSEVGHVGDMWDVQPEATLRLLTSFYDTGRVDDSLFTYAPMDFNVRFGLPVLAKLLLGTGVLPLVALGALFGRVARQARLAAARSSDRGRSGGSWRGS